MTSFQGTFEIFNATDVPGLRAQMNEWGGNLETAVSELRGAVLMQAGELTTLRDGLVLMEQRAAGITQFGGQAVAELDVLMQAFRAELVLRVAEGKGRGPQMRSFAR